MGLFSGIIDKVAQYFDVRFRLLKLNFVERTSNVLSYLIFVMIALFLFFAVLLFTGFGIAELLTVAFDSRIGGYFAAAGIYIILMLVVMGLHKQIAAKFSVLFIRLLTSGGDDDEDDDDNKDDIEEVD